MLFKSKERISLGPTKHNEGAWEYLDRSSRIEAERVRQFLNRWVTEYPASHRARMIAQFKSRTSHEFQAAFFELILFALLKTLGCEITIEPDLPNGSDKRPDFLVVTPEGESVYIEATLAVESTAKTAAKKRYEQLLVAIEKLHSPAFAVNVRMCAESTETPDGTALRQHLKTWLASLDPDAEFQRMLVHKLSKLPRTRWQNKGWVIECEAMARPPERRGLGQRVVGIQWGRVETLTSWQPVRDTIKKKGSRYGVLPHPYVVAINADDFFLDQEDEVQALFGLLQVTFNRIAPDSFSPTVGRKEDGVWLRKHTRVSGTWIFRGIGPWTVGRHPGTVYFNPWAAKPLPSFFAKFHHAEVVENQMEWRDGSLPREILGLPADWPS